MSTAPQDDFFLYLFLAATCTWCTACWVLCVWVSGQVSGPLITADALVLPCVYVRGEACSMSVRVCVYLSIQRECVCMQCRSIQCVCVCVSLGLCSRALALFVCVYSLFAPTDHEIQCENVCPYLVSLPMTGPQRSVAEMTKVVQ